MYIVVLITAKDKKQADKIATTLLKNKLIACANIIEKVSSIFAWQGKVERVSEALMVLKTKKSLFPEIVKQVKAIHSYSVPEIIALPIIAGQKDYLKWIEDSV